MAEHALVSQCLATLSGVQCQGFVRSADDAADPVHATRLVEALFPVASSLTPRDRGKASDESATAWLQNGGVSCCPPGHLFVLRGVAAAVNAASPAIGDATAEALLDALSRGGGVERTAPVAKLVSRTLLVLLQSAARRFFHVTSVCGDEGAARGEAASATRAALQHVATTASKLAWLDWCAGTVLACGGDEHAMRVESDTVGVVGFQRRCPACAECRRAEGADGGVDPIELDGFDELRRVVPLIDAALCGGAAPCPQCDDGGGDTQRYSPLSGERGRDTSSVTPSFCRLVSGIFGPTATALARSLQQCVKRIRLDVSGVLSYHTEWLTTYGAEHESSLAHSWPPPRVGAPLTVSASGTPSPPRLADLLSGVVRVLPAVPAPALTVLGLVSWLKQHDEVLSTLITIARDAFFAPPPPPPTLSPLPRHLGQYTYAAVTPHDVGGGDGLMSPAAAAVSWEPLLFRDSHIHSTNSSDKSLFPHGGGRSRGGDEGDETRASPHQQGDNSRPYLSSPPPSATTTPGGSLPIPPPIVARLLHCTARALAVAAIDGPRFHAAHAIDAVSEALTTASLIACGCDNSLVQQQQEQEQRMPASFVLLSVKATDFPISRPPSRVLADILPRVLAPFLSSLDTFMHRPTTAAQSSSRVFFVGRCERVDPVEDLPFERQRGYTIAASRVLVRWLRACIAAANTVSSSLPLSPNSAFYGSPLFASPASPSAPCRSHFDAHANVSGVAPRLTLCDVLRNAATIAASSGGHPDGLPRSPRSMTGSIMGGSVHSITGALLLERDMWEGEECGECEGEALYEGGRGGDSSSDGSDGWSVLPAAAPAFMCDPFDGAAIDAAGAAASRQLNGASTRFFDDHAALSSIPPTPVQQRRPLRLLGCVLQVRRARNLLSASPGVTTLRGESLLQVVLRHSSMDASSDSSSAHLVSSASALCRSFVFKPLSAIFSAALADSLKEARTVVRDTPIPPEEALFRVCSPEEADGRSESCDTTTSTGAAAYTAIIPTDVAMDATLPTLYTPPPKPKRQRDTTTRPRRGSAPASIASGAVAAAASTAAASTAAASTAAASTAVVTPSIVASLAPHMSVVAPTTRQQQQQLMWRGTGGVAAALGSVPVLAKPVIGAGLAPLPGLRRSAWWDMDAQVTVSKGEKEKDVDVEQGRSATASTMATSTLEKRHLQRLARRHSFSSSALHEISVIAEEEEEEGEEEGSTSEDEDGSSDAGEGRGDNAVIGPTPAPPAAAPAATNGTVVIPTAPASSDTRAPAAVIETSDAGGETVGQIRKGGSVGSVETVDDDDDGDGDDDESGTDDSDSEAGPVPISQQTPPGARAPVGGTVTAEASQASTTTATAAASPVISQEQELSTDAAAAWAHLSGMACGDDVRRGSGSGGAHVEWAQCLSLGELGGVFSVASRVLTSAHAAHAALTQEDFDDEVDRAASAAARAQAFTQTEEQPEEEDSSFEEDAVVKAEEEELLGCESVARLLMRDLSVSILAQRELLAGAVVSSLVDPRGGHFLRHCWSLRAVMLMEQGQAIAGFVGRLFSALGVVAPSDELLLLSRSPASRSRDAEGGGRGGGVVPLLSFTTATGPAAAIAAAAAAGSSLVRSSSQLTEWLTQSLSLPGPHLASAAAQRQAQQWGDGATCSAALSAFWLDPASFSISFEGFSCTTPEAIVQHGIRISYDAPYPATLLLTQHALSIYADAAGALLRVRLVLAQLHGVAHASRHVEEAVRAALSRLSGRAVVRVTDAAAAAAARRGTPLPVGLPQAARVMQQLRALALARAAALHAVSTVHASMAQGTIVAPWAALVRATLHARSLGAIREAHDEYLSTLQRRCFLGSGGGAPAAAASLARLLTAAGSLAATTCAYYRVLLEALASVLDVGAEAAAAEATVWGRGSGAGGGGRLPPVVLDADTLEHAAEAFVHVQRVFSGAESAGVALQRMIAAGAKAGSR